MWLVIGRMGIPPDAETSFKRFQDCLWRETIWPLVKWYNIEWKCFLADWGTASEITVSDLRILKPFFIKIISKEYATPLYMVKIMYIPYLDRMSHL